MNNRQADLQSQLTAIMQQLQLSDAPAGGSVVVYHKGQLIAEAIADPITTPIVELIL